MKRIAVIGSGFAGISAAAYLAKAGNEVHVYEKNSTPGGRARQFTTPNGFVFDMGPSWYWMPDIIENFFKDFGYTTSDYFELISLNPQFEMIFEANKIAVPKDYNELRTLFETIEKGAGAQLDKFIEASRFKYEIGMQDFIMNPCHSWLEFASTKIIKSSLKLNLLTNFRRYVSQYFKDEKLRAIMEFPVIFLGASPKNIPALYSLMNYGGYVLGTHYPKGGFYELVKAMKSIAEKQGVTFHFNKNVDKINVSNNSVQSLTINGEILEFDSIVASSDYHHTETLLDKPYRNYTEQYWDAKTFAPSCLIYYLGISEEIPNLVHHTLFFEHDMDKHIDCIYESKEWPEQPLFYVCCPSKTDANVAPKGKENLFLLMPLAIKLEDKESIREEYLQNMLTRIEKATGITNLNEKIEYKKSYCISDFITDYNAYGGNAYGLANTLNQTAVLKPKIKNKKLNNLYYTGQLTVPGPGVPPSIISGKIVANEINNLKT
jgi:phytoene desaturase